MCRFSSPYRSTRRITAASKPMPVLNRNGRRFARPDADALRGAASERRRAARWSRAIASLREAERARVHVGRTAGQRRERGVGVQQPVGGLVERAVAREHRDDVEPVVRGRAREPVAWPRRDVSATSTSCCAASSLRIITRLRAVTDDAVALTSSNTRTAGRVPAAAVGSRHRARAARPRRADAREIVECRACPRLVEWREQVAREKRAAFRDEEYWGRPVPGLR